LWEVWRDVISYWRAREKERKEDREEHKRQKNLTFKHVSVMASELVVIAYQFDNPE